MRLAMTPLSPNAALLAVILLLCCGSASGRVYQTDDAIIIEDDEYLARMQEHQLTKDNIDDKSPYPFLFGQQINVQTLPAIQFSNVQQKTDPMAQSSCFTMDGKFGYCTSVGSCYPNSQSLKMAPLIWATGTSSTCNYIETGGTQVQGVCCSVPTIDDNDAVTGGGRRTTSMVTVRVRYDGLAQPNLAFYYYYPYWQVIVPKNPVATMQGVPVSQTASGQGEFKQSSCGAGPLKTLSLNDQRVVGGNKAIKNSWPGMAALKFNGRFLCGGSLISKNKILTAAHCVNTWFMIFGGRFTVELGVHTVDPSSDAQVKRRVIRIARHYRFDPKTYRNDIAILTLDSPVTFTSSISPVCLPPIGSNDKHVNQTAAIIGWGSTREGGKMTSVLQQATVQIIANSQCKKQYTGENEIVDLMLCAGASGIDTCQGDSGGPLLVQSEPESPWIQAGVVSYGIGCADPKYPGVYTRVASYLAWMRKYM